MRLTPIPLYFIGAPLQAACALRESLQRITHLALLAIRSSLAPHLSLTPLALDEQNELDRTLQVFRYFNRSVQISFGPLRESLNPLSDLFERIAFVIDLSLKALSRKRKALPSELPPLEFTTTAEELLNRVLSQETFPDTLETRTRHRWLAFCCLKELIISPDLPEDKLPVPLHPNQPTQFSPSPRHEMNSYQVDWQRKYDTRLNTFCSFRRAFKDLSATDQESFKQRIEAPTNSPTNQESLLALKIQTWALRVFTYDNPHWTAALETNHEYRESL